MQYRLVLCDLDGTLLDEHRRIHPENVRVLQALMSQGVKFAFATGRAPGSVAPYVDIVKPNAPLIHMNGALVRDFGSGEVLFQKQLDDAHAQRAIALAIAHGFHINAYVGTEIWIERSTDTSRESEVKDGVAHTIKGDLVAALTGHRPIKLMNIGPAHAIPALTAALAAALVDAVALVNSEPTYLEVLPAGCSKGTAARVLCERLGIGMHEVIAFGDNLNDLEMLTEVGCGVAMKNAHPEVRARVSHHCGANDGDAIASFLKTHFPL